MGVAKVIRKQFSDGEKSDLLKRTSGRCAHCGCKLNLKTMTIEHMYPIDKGGDNGDFNIIAMCKKCNSGKSNFVYDLGFYPFIKDEYKGLYEMTLLRNIYGNSKDTDIFGQCTRVIRMVEPKMYDMLKRTGVNSVGAKRALAVASRQFEMRMMYKGDIDDDAIKVLANSYKRVNRTNGVINTVKTESVNEYLLFNLFDYSTFYGVYSNNRIISMHCFTNIDYLNLTNDKFKGEIDKRFKNVYAETIYAADPIYNEPLEGILAEIFIEYIAYTDNLILRNFIGEKTYMSAVMNGYNATMADFQGNSKLFNLDLEQEGLTLISGGGYYGSLIKHVDKRKERYRESERKLAEVTVESCG